MGKHPDCGKKAADWQKSCRLAKLLTGEKLAGRRKSCRPVKNCRPAKNSPAGKKLPVDGKLSTGEKDCRPAKKAVDRRKGGQLAELLTTTSGARSACEG
jgi:hypothetical protein